MLIHGREKLETEILKNPKAFIGYSQIIDNVYEIWKTMLQQQKCALIVLDDMIAVLEYNKKLNSIVTKVFLRVRKLFFFYLFLYHNLISKCLKLQD